MDGADDGVRLRVVVSPLVYINRPKALVASEAVTNKHRVNRRVRRLEGNIGKGGGGGSGRGHPLDFFLLRPKCN